MRRISGAASNIVEPLIVGWWSDDSSLGTQSTIYAVDCPAFSLGFRMFARFLGSLARQNVAVGFIFLLAILARLLVGLSSYSGEKVPLAQPKEGGAI